METSKAKNKGRPYRLRRMLLVMALGWAFTFWMPFIVIIDNRLHWLNYIIYWSAALVWMIPFMRWLRHNRYRSARYRLGICGLLLVLWCGAGLAGGRIVGHSLPVTDANYHAMCTIARHRHYICYSAQIEWSWFSSGDAVLERRTTRIVAEQFLGLPIARVIKIEPDYSDLNFW